jgi:UDP-2,4-diacetamido-2,4,6-trideoxy-beta-L-altropyranose hydrolase
VIDSNHSAFLVCDANKNVGSGHLMRQITLGNSLRLIGYQVRISCAEIPDALMTRAKFFELDVEIRTRKQSDSELATEILNATSENEIVIFDGYNFAYECILKVFESNRKIMLIDDNGDLAEMPCHMILNQNLHSSKEMYKSNESMPHLLLGPKWALIRPEVLEVRKNQNLNNRSGVFVTVGGTDPMGITRLLADELRSHTNSQVKAAGGFLEDSSLTPHEMAVQMGESGIGVVACGTTTWEACCLGLPIIGLIVANNQIKVAESLLANGLAESIDCRTSDWISKAIKAVNQLQQDHAKRNLMTERGRSLVDGNGAHRVAMQIQQLINR